MIRPADKHDAPARSVASSNELASAWIQENVPFGIFTTDTQLTISSWNRWLVTHSGLPAIQVIGRNLFEAFPDLVTRHLDDRFLRAISGETSILSTALHKYLLPFTTDGSDLAESFMLQTARIAPLFDGSKVIGTIATIEDVTRRELQASILHRQRELDGLLSSALGKLLQSEDPAEAVAEIFPTLMPSLGLDTYLSYLLGPNAKTLHLHAAGGLLPKQRELIARLPLAAEDLNAPSRTEAIPSTVARLEQLLRSAGLKVSCSFPLAIGNRLFGLASFGSYQRENIPQRDVRILSRIARYIAIALERAAREREIQAASRAKDDFLAALSHELRTPLNPVLLLASESAGNLEYPAEARESFRVIEKNALVEARLIDDLLDLTRIERGKLSLELEPVDVHMVVRDTLVMVQNDLAERDFSLEVRLLAETSQTLGDAGRLQQVFGNLLSNAIKFTPSGGGIRVRSSIDQERGEIVVSFTDTGIGVEPDELRRIFEAFAQGEHARERHSHRFGGLGLGLAISRKIVELHSGHIEVTSEGRNKGSTFSVHLPLRITRSTSAPAPTDCRAPSTVEALASAERKPHSPAARILLVEDHHSTRTTLTQLLARRGYHVVAVGSSSAALQEASIEPFDLVLSDIGLPDGDGMSLMKQLRSRYGMRGIALTGYGMEGDLAGTREAGFIAHLTKPIKLPLLENTLAAALRAVRS